MLSFRHILNRLVAVTLTIIYITSLIFVLIAGIAHELHHIFTHTLEQHNHHGESHHNPAGHNTSHRHNDLVDVLLKDARSQDHEESDSHVVLEIRCFDHNAINLFYYKLVCPEDRESYFPFVRIIHPQYTYGPELPPPKT